MYTQPAIAIFAKGLNDKKQHASIASTQLLIKSIRGLNGKVGVENA